MPRSRPQGFFRREKFHEDADQGGYVVGFNGRSHKILKGGEIVIDDDRISFVGFAYSEPANKTLTPGGARLAGFVNSHIHPNSNAGDYFLNDPDKTDYLGSNIRPS